MALADNPKSDRLEFEIRRENISAQQYLSALDLYSRKYVNSYMPCDSQDISSNISKSYRDIFGKTVFEIRYDPCISSLFLISRSRDYIDRFVGCIPQEGYKPAVHKHLPSMQKSDSELLRSLYDDILHFANIAISKKQLLREIESARKSMEDIQSELHRASAKQSRLLEEYYDLKESAVTAERRFKLGL